MNGARLILNEIYWILPTIANNQGNMYVDLNRMNNLLQQI
jgi:hypothetical protein